jgi:hypothetical protein
MVYFLKYHTQVLLYGQELTFCYHFQIFPSAQYSLLTHLIIMIPIILSPMIHFQLGLMLCFMPFRDIFEISQILPTF